MRTVSILQLERRLRVLGLDCRGVINEPVYDARCPRPNSAGWETFLRYIQDFAQHILFPGARSDEGNFGRMVDDRQCERDALWRWLRAVTDVSDPALFLGEQGVAREETGGVSIRPHAEEDKVEYREAGGILLGEFRDELRFIVICDDLQCILVEVGKGLIHGRVIFPVDIVRQDTVDVDRMDVLARDLWNLGEQFVLTEEEVGVFVI